MNTTTPWHLAAAVALALSLAACGDRDAARTAAPESAASPAPAAPPPAPTTDQWIGQWNGPEGSFVRITGGNGHYDLTVQNLDGPRTFAGTAVADTIEFERDGQRLTLRASDGAGTGMKWLAGKKDCLRVRVGELTFPRKTATGQNQRYGCFPGPREGQGEAMKKSRFSEEQIAYALRMADGGTSVVDVCRQIGISEATFYTWKKKYGELGVSELRKLRQLEDENARLRRIVADLTLDKQILQEVVKKKL